MNKSTTYDIHRQMQHKTLENIVTAAYIAGYQTAWSQKKLTHPDVIEELKRLRELLIHESD